MTSKLPHRWRFKGILVVRPTTWQLPSRAWLSLCAFCRRFRAIFWARHCSPISNKTVWTRTMCWSLPRQRRSHLSRSMAEICTFNLSPTALRTLSTIRNRDQPCPTVCSSFNLARSVCCKSQPRRASLISWRRIARAPSSCLIQIAAPR